MYERYIATAGDLYGYWGSGDTPKLAVQKLHKAAGKHKRNLKGMGITKFTSEFPFAPGDRPATEREADAYVSKDGMMCSIRCERELLSEDAISKAKGGA